jgi:hypothetical protein
LKQGRERNQDPEHMHQNVLGPAEVIQIPERHTKTTETNRLLISVSLQLQTRHDPNNCKYRDTFQALLTTTGIYVMPVDILILGAGWTSSFLIPLCQQQAISYATTTRSGTHSTIKFVFDPDSDVLEPFENLPDATSILICFPIAKCEASKRLVNLYMKSRRSPNVNACFIQLGTSGIWDVSRL